MWKFCAANRNFHPLSRGYRFVHLGLDVEKKNHTLARDTQKFQLGEFLVILHHFFQFLDFIRNFKNSETQPLQNFCYTNDPSANS